MPVCQRRELARGKSTEDVVESEEIIEEGKSCNGKSHLKMLRE